jgi:hypothetical protein
MSHTRDAERENRSPRIRVTVVIGNRYAFDAEEVTGRQIMEKANAPAASLCTAAGAPSMHDDDAVELHDGDHFFARPRGPASH